MIKFNNKTFSSSAEIFFDIFSDKIKLRIIWYLSNNPLRFTELLACLAPITKKTLSLKLKELESLHLINREVFAQVPPKVEYSLKKHGKNLTPVINEILIFSQAYAKDFATTITKEMK